MIRNFKLRSTRLHRSFYFFILFCTVSLILNGCTSKESVRSDSLVVALSSAPATLDPRRATDATGMRLCNLIFQSLVRVGSTLDVEGDAAESWTYKDKVYEFQLKKGLRFQNGRSVTREDIEFSFSEFKSPKSPFSSAFSTIQKVEVLEKQDQLTVRVHVDQFAAKFLSSDLPVLKILPKEEIEKDEKGFTNRPMGSGPLKVQNINDQHIVLKRKEGLPAESDLFQAFEFKVIKDDFTRSQKILKGEIDIAIAELPPDIVKRLESKESERVHVYTYPGLSMTYVLVNLKDPDLARKEVRQAISQAIHREEIIKYKLLGLGVEATSILTPENPYFNKDLKNDPYDIEKAKSILSEVGMLSLKTSSNPTAVDHGKVLANQIEKAGVQVNLQSFEWGTFYNDIKTGNFQLATMKWVGAFDPDIYRIAFHSSELPPGRNRSSYINKDLDLLLEKAFHEESFESRKKMYNEIQRIIFDEYIIIPLWYETQAAVVRKSLTGFKPSVLSDYSALLEIRKLGAPSI